MSLEQAIQALTAAVEANTAALKGSASSAGKAGGTTSAKTEKKADEYKPKHTKEEMLSALTTLKEKTDTDTARKIVKEIGGKAKMAEIEDPKAIDACYEEATKQLEALADDDV